MNPLTNSIMAKLIVAIGCLLLVGACSDSRPRIVDNALPVEQWNPIKGAPRGIVILVHDCEGVTREKDELSLWASLLAERGFRAVLLKDFLLENCAYPEAPSPVHRAARLSQLVASLSAEPESVGIPVYALGFGHGGNSVMRAAGQAPGLVRSIAVYPDCSRSDAVSGDAMSDGDAGSQKNLLVLAVGPDDAAAACVGLVDALKARIHVYPNATIKFDSKRVTNRAIHRYDPVAHQDALHRIADFLGG